ncbi:hypothetical protein ASPACDRAFT_1857973 [Aspergillus aculeatus ATCC 16872]|uniref:Uncharacterized protein n=1 Tax=Aspergillus aculeatus (strain ATCC 16872 / CBS 172.66 / WB 5094) TaxID=690307 RepID=A0A1L9WP76_ASPA1|nr:uncharacterized protein ASPACDRAFT_1857973 [Aspergillus aculeatus ATCC 16872]OJJ97954.1 hypothetical protein ASPACDRAFT_1857973 [Aspergillus aculeatus ATCC 16872]
MVVFVDYDHDAFGRHSFPGVPDTLLHSSLEPQKPTLSKLLAIGPAPSKNVPAAHDQSADPSQNHTYNHEYQQHALNWNAFSAALSCYPIIKEIARAVDLNTLHALSQTCRQFHANLAPYRSLLIKQTLRCENEYIETVSDMLDSGAAIPDSVKSVLQLLSQNARASGRITTGKVAKCARDMVAECRRCSKVVCRNCIIKPPSSSMYKNRIRRLCTTCQTAPLSDLIDPLSSSSQSAMAPESSALNPKPTAIAFQRTPCNCYEAIWLCHQCGHRVRSNDTTYRRVWTWRTRYSTYLGGLGTGIGEGCQGVKCGREDQCLAAKEIELEVECEADEASGGSSPDYSHYYEHRNHAHSPPRHTTIESWDHREGDEPGYFRQEIIGIGGRVKQKAKKRIVVGACVAEHEDERETGEYLTREEKGEHRSWCGWCWRVIPAKGEIQ